MDQITAMRVFVAVIDEEGFAAAAARVGMSRAMVSKHVMDLETHLDARLMNRTTRRQSLTGVGRTYYERAKRILSALQEADAEAAQESLCPSGRLRVNAPMSFGVLHVAPHLKSYLDRYPDVQVDLTLNDRVVDLVDEGYDLAIRIGTLADSSLIARRIATSRLIACAAPAYLDARGTPRHPAELEAHSCLAYSNAGTPDRWDFRAGGETLSARLRPRLFCNNGDALLAAAVSGLGIIVQPDFIVAAALAEARLRRIMPDFDAGALGVFAIHPSSRLVSARVRTFIDHLAASLARYGGLSESEESA